MSGVQKPCALACDLGSTNRLSESAPVNVLRPAEERLGKLRCGYGLESVPVLVVEHDVHATMDGTDLLDDGEVTQRHPRDLVVWVVSLSSYQCCADDGEDVARNQSHREGEDGSSGIAESCQLALEVALDARKQRLDAPA